MKKYFIIIPFLTIALALSSCGSEYKDSEIDTTQMDSGRLDSARNIDSLHNDWPVDTNRLDNSGNGGAQSER